MSEVSLVFGPNIACAVAFYALRNLTVINSLLNVALRHLQRHTKRIRSQSEDVFIGVMQNVLFLSDVKKE